MRFVYRCKVTPDDDGSFFVSFPDVPGALTSGASRADALEMAVDALTAVLATYVRDQRDLPRPGPAVDRQPQVALPPVVAAKLALYTAMREQGVSQAACRSVEHGRGKDSPAARSGPLDPHQHGHEGAASDGPQSGARGPRSVGPNEAVSGWPRHCETCPPMCRTVGACVQICERRPSFWQRKFELSAMCGLGPSEGRHSAFPRADRRDLGKPPTAHLAVRKGRQNAFPPKTRPRTALATH